MTTIEVWRSGWVVDHKSDNGETAKGEISEVWIGDKLICWALERLDGYVRLDEGTYTMKMECSPSCTVKVGKDQRIPRKQFRVYGHNKLGGKAPILVHAANFPGELEGCIGPGLVPTNDGVDQTELAMHKLFGLFGGFKVGNEGGLLVTRG